MRVRQSVAYALRWDLTIIAIAALVVTLLAWVRDPTVTVAENETVSGSRPPDRAEGDILLLLPDSPAAYAAQLDDLDCSYGWFNSLWQEYGSFATALTRDLSPEVLAGRATVIVPARVAQNMPNAGVRAIAEFAKRGGQVVLEQPGDAWTAIAASSLSGKSRKAQRITSVEGLGVHGELRELLPKIPLQGRLLPAPAMEPFPHGAAILAIDDQPGWAITRVGDGSVHTLYFNFGCSVTALQQGTPQREMSFGNTPSEYVHAETRRAQPGEAEFRAPLADLLERAVFTRISEDRPTPRLWLYPGAFAGALLMSHAAPEAARAGLALAEAADRAGASATVFVAADRFGAEDAAHAEKISADVGLLWVRGKRRPLVVDSVGVGAIRPFAHELDLNTQFTRVNVVLPETRPLRAVRVEDAEFVNDWATTFKQLAAARFRLDSSLGPDGGRTWGYLFGTGFPFYPLDERGLPLPLVEQPYLLSGSGVSATRIDTLLSASAQGFHQPIVVGIPADIMKFDPAPGVLLGLRDAFDLAAKHNHWATSIGEFLEFLGARRRSVLTSQWSAAERRLTITVNLLGAQADSLADKEVAAPGQAVPGVAFPRTHAGAEVESVTLDGDEYPLKRVATSGASTDRILVVPPGRHTIVVRYKSTELVPVP